MENIIESIKKRQGNIIILLICLLAGIIRIANLDFLLDYFEIPDEYILANSAIQVDSANLFHPPSFKYGSFPMYWSSLIFNIYYFFIWFSTKSQLSFPDFVLSFQNDGLDPALFYLGRLSSVLFGIASIYVLFLIAKRLFNEKAGCWSAFLMTISPLHVFFSQLYKVDISLLLWILLVVYYSVKIFEEGKIKYYILAGIFVGFSVSTKYNFLIIIPVLTAYLLTERKFSSALIKPFLFVLIVLFSYLATCPYCYIDLSKVIAQIHNEIIIQRVGFPKDLMRLPPYLTLQIIGTVVLLFPFYFNPLFYVFSIIGVKKIYQTKGKLLIVLLSFPLLYLIVAEMFTSLIAMPQHYLPLFPFILILCSYYISNYIHKILSLRFILLAVFICYDITNLIMPFASYKAYLNQYENLGKWIINEIPANGRILSNPGFMIPNQKLEFMRENRRIWVNNFNLETLRENQPEYIIMESIKYFRENDYQEMFETLKNDSQHYQIIADFRMPVVKIIENIIHKDYLYGIYVFKVIPKKEKYAPDRGLKSQGRNGLDKFSSRVLVRIREPGDREQTNFNLSELGRRRFFPWQKYC